MSEAAEVVGAPDLATDGAHDGPSDAELIRRYLDRRDEAAVRTLVERHHDQIHRRFRREFRNDADAEDWAQRLWIRVLGHLDDYRDEGKFPQFLSTIATNMIKDHWRRGQTHGRVFVDSADTDEDHERHGRMSDARDPERAMIDDELVAHLTRTLIPALPSEQRAAWLLRHESEYWEPGRPLQWTHLAELNGMETDSAWRTFESARRKLMVAVREDRATPMDADETLVFLVWTQAQRAAKDESFSWEYFSELLGVPVNTMKTRYRSAQKRLAEALDDYRSDA